MKLTVWLLCWSSRMQGKMQFKRITWHHWRLPSKWCSVRWKNKSLMELLRAIERILMSDLRHAFPWKARARVSWAAIKAWIHRWGVWRLIWISPVVTCAMQWQVITFFTVIMALKPHEPHLHWNLLSLSAAASCFNMSDIDSRKFV